MTAVMPYLETTPRVGGRVGEPIYGGTLRLAVPEPIRGLDPTGAVGPATGQLLRVLTRQLFGYPATGTHDRGRRAPVADLAEELPTLSNGGFSSDGSTCTVSLRAGVYWDTVPPRPVVAGDVIRGLRRCTALASTVRGMCALDDRTVVLLLARPFVDVPRLLARPAATPVPAEDDEPPGFPCSLGPYRITRYRDGGRYVRLERNPVWSPYTDPLRAQFVDEIEVRTSSDALPMMAVRNALLLPHVDAIDLASVWLDPTA